VAATDVVAAQFDPMTAARTLLLVMALAAWGAVVTRLVAVLLASESLRCKPTFMAVGCSRWSQPSRSVSALPTRPCRGAY
jgi:hypothetical protein